MVNYRSELVKSFKKYCIECSGKCCKGKTEVTIFRWELEKFLRTSNKISPINYATVGKSNILHLYLGKKCIFLGEKGCELKINNKPLDCISYPIFPKIEFANEGRPKITSVVIHKSCPCAARISQDKKLINLLLKFWKLRLKKELKELDNEDLKKWFNSNLKTDYWSEKNIIKIDV